MPELELPLVLGVLVILPLQLQLFQDALVRGWGEWRASTRAGFVPHNGHHEALEACRAIEDVSKSPEKATARRNRGHAPSSRSLWRSRCDGACGDGGGAAAIH